MSPSQQPGAGSSREPQDLVREQLLDYGRLLAQGNELLETLRTYPGPAKLKNLAGSREAISRSLKSRAERMESEGFFISGNGPHGLPPGARAELRRAVEAVLEVEDECRKLHEEHLERLRGGIQSLQHAREVVAVYSDDVPSSHRTPRGRVNLNG